ncbi:MAG: cysteine--tRNA ligase [Omnitrophica WOR_2 bacterium RIFCSPLOWO2_12_FULL_46_30]|nr:MAG: cysteine--tRNA ligase [Omnitrophica WOR_2 bacterium RIFCSPHIGHO2_02_FULL_46_37]OGX52353.1 MAG: cysteine--tRNA ligase [Omnitrophica WOR_2 bacterium RIFCSPLOWO2_12_FULL_46_30]
MPVYVYNSLTRKKEPFEPVNPPQLNMYTCGVTVYDACHLGHARSLYIFDVFRRYLAYCGYKVNFVRNITDIDDKIINRAQELKMDWRALAEKYIESYKNDLKELEIREADAEPRATENIPEMLKHIEGLIAKGYAYITDTGVYFSVRKFGDYGKLSGQGINQMLSGARIEPDETKQDSLDFALWKISKPDEPSWPSPFGRGRPGWHIECSVMSAKYLNTETLDIHAGGRDLIFPHHENEIAQSEALTDKPFARYWLHHGLLTINSQKMAKSSGNFITLKDFINKYRDKDILKLFFLSAHYAHPIDYTDKKIEEAKAALERFHILLRKAQAIVRDIRAPGIKFPIETINFIEKHKNRFIEAMDDNFNMPIALSCLFDLANETNKFIDSEKSNPRYTEIIHQACEETIIELGNKIFGLFSDLSWQPLTDEERALLDKRKQSRQGKDFKTSDGLREELRKRGIIAEDTKEGQSWRRA